MAKVKLSMRLSGEIYGFTWALLAGGAGATVSVCAVASGFPLTLRGRCRRRTAPRSYALRDKQVLRIAVADGREIPIGAPATGTSCSVLCLTAACSASSMTTRCRVRHCLEGTGRFLSRHRHRTTRSAGGTDYCCRRCANMLMGHALRCGAQNAVGGGATSSCSPAAHR